MRKSDSASRIRVEAGSWSRIDSNRSWNRGTMVTSTKAITAMEKTIRKAG